MRSLGLCAALFATAASATSPIAAPPPYEEASAAADGDGRLIYNFGQRHTVPVGDGVVRVSADTNTTAPRAGYALLRVNVENLGPRPEKVRLAYEWRGGGAARSLRDVEVAPGRRTVSWLLVPAGALHGTVSATGRGITDNGRVALYFTEPQARALLNLGTDTQFQDAAQTAPDSSHYANLVRTVAPEEAPHELAAYVGFNAVVVSAPFEELAEPARRAVEAYAALGGAVVLVKPPRTVSGAFPLLGADAAAGRHDYGFGQVRLCGEDAAACARALSADAARSSPLVLPSTGDGHAWSARRYEPYAQEDVQPIPEAERFLLPQATAPVGRFLLIILAFTLAIGPGSVWVARRKGPPMLLLSIPLTAGVTCLLIVAWSVLVDGFSVHSATRGYTLLDGKNKRALTVGVQAYYANVSPGDARYDTTTAVLGPRTSHDGNQLLSVDWTRGTRVDGDFIPSRTYREWGLVSVAPTRARLLARLSEDGQSLTVENGLGADVRNLRVSLGGREWQVGALADGSRAEVQGSAELAPFAGEDGAVPFHSRFRTAVTSRMTGALPEGGFHAELKGAAFLPQGGLRLSYFSNGHVVRGEVER